LNIIHKDINPSNIIIQPETGKIKIIDFGISTVFNRETLTLKNPNVLEGTLAYISPEQTGRMNRSLDYRTDFYSLGVTFYELLTGQLPFITSDSLELVHCHIAKQPIPPSEINLEIPSVLSAIVLKLMAKTAEERYQSAFGIQADLAECLRQLETEGRISDFPLGRQDISDYFQIPQKLYGREEEVEILLSAFDRVVRPNAPIEMMLVAGYSGIGKSSLVAEIHKPNTRLRGYFTEGKFDQFQRSVPYSAIVSAFKGLVRQLLGESEAELQHWQQKLLAALGNNGQVIIEVIPEVELIIGKQPDLPQLGATESQNRFNLVLQNFIGVFAQKEHPLVMFIDDLQWADSASLKLLELLMSDRDRQYLLTIGAYRDNEVDSTHPLMQTIERIQQQETRINTFVLEPLRIDWVNQLIADTLKCSTEESQPLADLIFEKTRGNPFFLTQLLQSLYAENLLLFTPSLGCWQWDVEQIQAIGITDNVIDLMISKIEKLDEDAQNTLKLATCIGNRFNLEVLSVVNTKSQAVTAKEIWPALDEGLIIPLNDDYKIPLLWDREEMQRVPLSQPSSAIPFKFLHDRVQQAAYALIPSDRKKEVHLQVGQLLLENIQQEDLEENREENVEENIFDIVNQLNIGAELMSDRSAQNRLIQLNLIAGRKAKNAAAYAPSLKYLEMGLMLLSPESWQHQYELTLALHIEAVEAKYINTQFEEAENLSAIVQQQSRDLLDEIKTYELKIQSCMAKLQLQLAIEVAFEALEKLGIFLPQKPSQQRIEEEKKSLELLLKDKEIKDLFDLPDMSDLYKQASVRIILSVTAASFITSSELFTMVTITAVNLCIQYGNPPQAPGVYIFLGMLLCGSENSINEGYQFGQLALNLLDKFNPRDLQSLVLHYSSGFIRHWKEPARNSIAMIQDAINVGLDTGDLEHVSYNASAYCIFSLFTGTHLAEMSKKYEEYINLTIKIKQQYTVYYMRNCQSIVVNLLNGYESVVVGESPVEEESILEQWHTVGAVWLLFSCYLAKTISSYFFGHYEQAANSSRECAKYAESSAAYIVAVQHNFYSSLALLAHCHNSGANPTQTLEQVESNQKTMKIWAENCPENFQHKYDLVEAEKAFILHNKNWEAQEFYERAISGAQKNQYIHEEAIAYERGANFYFTMGWEEIGRLYLKNAHYAYQRWGAVAKTEAMEAEDPTLFHSTTSLQDTRVTLSSSDTSGGKMLDLTTVIKSTNALSSEIVLEKLLATLMNVLVENAGAERGILILPDNEKLLVEATKETASESVSILQSLPLEEFAKLSLKIVNYVARTRETIVLNNALKESDFSDDPYIQEYQCQSIACTPFVNQGKLQGIVYLENNLTIGAFTKERIALLQTLSAQAAISIENARLYDQLEEYNRTLEQKVEERTAELSQTVEVLKETQAELRLENELLKSDEEADSFDYQIGGSLTVDSPTYVVRSADRHLYQAMRSGEFCYTFNARQMGKSSLMVRIMNGLKKDGYRCIAIDLTAIGGENTTADQWYKGIAVEIWRKFGLLRKFKLKPWWSELTDIPAPQRLMQFIEEVVLTEVKQENSDEPAKIVIFVDEIDCILSLNFPVNDFFALIRSCYNQRAIDSKYQRLTFALFGVATPSSLMTDPQKTPFNIGRPIHLEGFKINEAQPLLYGLTVNNPQTILKAIIDWTGGQPFLTQKVCKFIRNAKSGIPMNGEGQWIADLVQENILKNWESKDDPEHLKTIRDRILKSDRREQLLTLYQQVLRPEETPATYSEVEQELLLSGLAIAREGILKVNNRIYHSIFDLDWVERQLSIINEQ
jgi:predicted ATPase/GAF domain-containing protein